MLQLARLPQLFLEYPRARKSPCHLERRLRQLFQGNQHFQPFQSILERLLSRPLQWLQGPPYHQMDRGCPVVPLHQGYLLVQLPLGLQAHQGFLVFQLLQFVRSLLQDPQPQGFLQLQ